MAIPDYQTCMLPLLKFSSDKKEHSLREAVDKLAEHFRLTDAELKELLVKMGYGGSRKDAGRAIGKTGDKVRGRA